jgi:hypothetical protein
VLPLIGREFAGFGFDGRDVGIPGFLEHIPLQGCPSFAPGSETDEIRKVIYTTNAIESLNGVIRKAVERRKLFPTDQPAMKVVYLAIEQVSKKWSMPIRDWKPAL